MRNPLRSEAEAYRFLGVVIVGAAVIIAGAYINTWLGVAVAVLAFAALGRWLVHEPVPGAADPARVVASGTPPGTYRVLVVAPPGTETVTVPDGAEVLVVVPALASTLEALTGERECRLELVEVRPDRPARAGRGQCVAAGALALEDRGAARPDVPRGCRPAGAHDRGDVGGDVDRILAGDEVRRHRRLVRELLVRRVRGDLAGAEPDLVEHDVLDRALRVALFAIRPEGVVEVGADRPTRPRRRECVADGAFLGEELLAGLRVRPLRTACHAARAAAGRERRSRREPCPQDPDPVRVPQPCGTPTADNASSRVG